MNEEVSILSKEWVSSCVHDFLNILPLLHCEDHLVSAEHFFPFN